MAYNETPKGKVIMPRKEHVAIVVLLALNILDTRTHIRNKRRFKKLLETHNEFRECHESLHEQMCYLVNKLNEEGVQLDEFDLIVLSNVIQQ